MPSLTENRCGLVGVAMTICLLLCAPAAASAQASTYVSASDPAYSDLDVLVSAGLVTGLILGQRAYSRMTFVRAAAQARGGLQTGRFKSRFEEAVARLEAGFQPELALLCDESAGPCPEVLPQVQLRGVALESSGADNPGRMIAASYIMPEYFTTLPDFIDADVAPLLQGNQGRYLADGLTVAAEAWGGATLGRRFVAEIRPRAWLARSRGSGTDVEAALLQGYLRGVFGDLSVEVGRRPVSHGSARAYSPALSGNARGLDMVRLSRERPGRLPWIFRHLGPASFAALVADLGSARDNPGSVLIVYEGGVLPHPNLELGFAFTNQQGGERTPEASLSDRFFDIFFLQDRRPFTFLPPDPQISDKSMGLDARLTIPQIGAKAWVEFVTTDDHWTALDALGEVFRTEAAWTGGIQVSGLGAAGRVDVWAEVGHNGVRPYTHHQFTSGYTLDRRVLGSPLGPLATGWQAGLDWTGPRDRVSFAGAQERYSGDVWWDRSGHPIRWELLEDNPDETRLRGTLAWIREPASTGPRATVRLGYEHVTRFDFTDQNRANWLAQVRLDYLF